MNDLIVSAIAMLLLAPCALMGETRDTVIYVPGWHRCHRGADEAFCAAAAKLAGELMSMPDEKLSQLTLVGHSLGARIIVRALAKLAVEGKKIKTAVILAAAMPSNDPDALNFTAATIEQATIVCNPKDTMLKYGYHPFGGEKARALGLTGPAMMPTNCRVITVLPETTRQTPLTALWAKFNLFRTIAAHYAPFYLEQLKRSR